MGGIDFEKCEWIGSQYSILIIVIQVIFYNNFIILYILFKYDGLHEF